MRFARRIRNDGKTGKKSRLLRPGVLEALENDAEPHRSSSNLIQLCAIMLRRNDEASAVSIHETARAVPPVPITPPGIVEYFPFVPPHTTRSATSP